MRRIARPRTAAPKGPPKGGWWVQTPPRGCQPFSVDPHNCVSAQTTEFPHGTHPPTRDFEKWDGEMFAYTPRRLGRKKQNPVSLGDTPRVPEGHIRKGSKGSSVCAPEGHRGAAPKRVPRGHTSRRASPQCSGRVKQGSLTARAPVQAGDAGSSPAPVANLQEERRRLGAMISYGRPKLAELSARLERGEAAWVAVS